MKKLFLYTCIACMLFLTACSGGNRAGETITIDEFPVIFMGEIAFSETESMRTAAILLPDSVSLILKSIDADSSWRGTFGRWTIQDKHILLDAGNEGRLLLGLAKNGMEVLNNDGESIGRTDKFILQAQNPDKLGELVFEAVGVYNYFADAATIRFCHAPRLMPVAMQGDHLAVETAFLEFSQQEKEKPFFVDALMHIDFSLETESAFKFQIVVNQFLSVPDLEDCP